MNICFGFWTGYVRVDGEAPQVLGLAQTFRRTTLGWDSRRVKPRPVFFEIFLRRRVATSLGQNVIWVSSSLVPQLPDLGLCRAARPPMPSNFAPWALDSDACRRRAPRAARSSQLAHRINGPFAPTGSRGSWTARLSRFCAPLGLLDDVPDPARQSKVGPGNHAAVPLITFGVVAVLIARAV